MFTPLFRGIASRGRRLLTVTMSVGISVSIIVTSIFPQQVFGYTAVKGTVKAASGVVRESASKASACAFCVKSGEEVIILDEVKGKDSNTWYKIKVLNSIGYIRSDLVKKSNIAVKVDTEQIDALQGKTEENADSQTASNSEFTSQLGKIKGTGINVRKTPVDGKIVTRVTAGDSVTVSKYEMGTDGNIWYAVSFVQNKKALNGYIRSDFVEGISIPEATQLSAADIQTGNKTGVIKGTSVRIRDKEVSGAVVVQLNTGHDFTVLDEVTGSDNYTWYKISFEYQGVQKEGYVRSDLTLISSGMALMNVGITDEAFEQTIKELPESYKNQLRALHIKYPKWQIVPVNTGLDWNDVVNAECAIGKNLTTISSIASWKSTDPRAYNQSTGTWYGFDGGAWAAASPEIIKYYLDPRNFLDDSGIFQFETLEYQDYQNDAGTANILAGSFMNGSYTDTDGITRSYAGTFVEAGRENGISPYHLATRCLQEQGLTGTSDCVKGNVSGYENLFNFFNIGAYAANGLSAPMNGLIYASGYDEAYRRPWNTRYASIYGAAKYISEKYVKKGQNTHYFQKFNVINAENGIYSHQYMSNICAASVEGARLKKAYPDLNTSLVFRIPYYSNMPENPCSKPLSSSNPSNCLASLSVDGYALSPGFSGATEKYTVTVDKNCTSINIQATPLDPLASVGGTGTVPVYQGTNVYYVVCKAQNGTTKTYILTIVYK